MVDVEEAADADPVQSVVLFDDDLASSTPEERPGSGRRGDRAEILECACRGIEDLYVTGVGRGSVRYSYEHRLPREITGQFVDTPRGRVKLFAWRDPQNPYRDDGRVTITITVSP